MTPSPELVLPAPVAPHPAPVILRIAPGEAWCAKCGEVIHDGGRCSRCGSRRTRPAAQCLQHDRGEYYIAT